MNNSELTPEDRDYLLRLCKWVLLGDCPTPFDFRAFLLGRLESAHASLAAKVQRLDEAQLEALCREVLDSQRSIDGAPSPSRPQEH